MLDPQDASDLQALKEVCDRFNDLGVGLGLISRSLRNLQNTWNILVFRQRGEYFGQVSEHLIREKIGPDREPIVAVYNGPDADGLIDVSFECRQHGKTILVTVLLSEDEIDTLDEANLSEECKYLSQYANNLRVAVPQARDATARLPKHLLDALSAGCKEPWLPRVRRDCLDWLTAWPGETRSESLGNKKLTPSIVTMLKNAANYDPHETWNKYSRRLDQYTNEVRALRPAAVDWLP